MEVCVIIVLPMYFSRLFRVNEVCYGGEYKLDFMFFVSIPNTY